MLLINKMVKKYLDGKLTGDELAEVELLLKTEQWFVHKVEHWRKMKYDPAYRKAAINFSRRLKKVEKELEAEGFFENFKKDTIEIEKLIKKKHKDCVKKEGCENCPTDKLYSSLSGLQMQK